jgi:hypothetical protein
MIWAFCIIGSIVVILLSRIDDRLKEIRDELVKHR